MEEETHLMTVLMSLPFSPSNQSSSKIILVCVSRYLGSFHCSTQKPFFSPRLKVEESCTTNPTACLSSTNPPSHPTTTPTALTR